MLISYNKVAKFTEKVLRLWQLKQAQAAELLMQTVSHISAKYFQHGKKNESSVTLSNYYFYKHLLVNTSMVNKNSTKNLKYSTASEFKP